MFISTKNVSSLMIMSVVPNLLKIDCKPCE